MIMEKIKKYIGLFYFFVNAVIQISFFSYYFPEFGNFDKYLQYGGFFDSFLLWLFAEGVFGDNISLRYLVLVLVILYVVSLVLFFIALFFSRKIVYSILLSHCILNVIFHFILLSDKPYAFIGLIFKIIGCCIYLYCLKKIKEKNQGTVRNH